MHTSQNTAEKSLKPRYIFLQRKTTGIFFPSVVFTFIDIFHWKFCRQNYSTGQIKVKRSITLSIWIVYIIIWRFFRLHRFYPFLVISIVSDNFVCFASFSSCLKEFHKRSSGHFARSPQTRENLLWHKIAVPLSVFVSGSLIYTLGT